jgi:hypothetical protein
MRLHVFLDGCDAPTRTSLVDAFVPRSAMDSRDLGDGTYVKKQMWIAGLKAAVTFFVWYRPERTCLSTDGKRCYIRLVDQSESEQSLPPITKWVTDIRTVDPMAAIYMVRVKSLSKSRAVLTERVLGRFAESLLLAPPYHIASITRSDVVERFFEMVAVDVLGKAKPRSAFHDQVTIRAESYPEFACVIM